MYCLTTDNGEPPTVETKYELVQSVGSRLLSQGNSCLRKPRRSPLGQLDELVDAELRIDLNEQVDVVGHDLKLDQLRLGLVDDVSQDFLEPFIHAGSQNRTPELRAPHDVVLAGIDDVSVALVLHASIIQIEAIESTELNTKYNARLISPCLKAGALRRNLVKRSLSGSRTTPGTGLGRKCLAVQSSAPFKCALGST